ncbi:MAG TPA: hydantoinase/carbamoylase family amidase [Solirubrobacteraceae bacterium]|nr:hydantoinase/carbamoylase family amidase [Solirubrobacteraceae bacterium]
MSIAAEAIGARLAGLDGVGVGEHGVHRLAWTAEDAACREWFAAQAAEAGLSVERDPAGNLWACPDAEPPWWGVGSHLDSVRGGGRFDGPLGVACGFAIAADARVPVAVVSFADEEGARFNTPTFGSKALAGRLDLPGILERRDEHGVALGEAMGAAGVDPAGIERAPAWRQRLRGFVEIHIDQSTEVARAGLPVAVVSALATRCRLEAELRGRADHAGTTPREERRDALAAAARLIVAADELGAEAGVTVTTARMLVEPNAATTIAELVRLWIDGRSADAVALETWRAALGDAAGELAGRSGVEIALELASRSAGRAFDSGLRLRLRQAGQDALGRAIPEAVCFAGHDAGVLAEHLPAAMVLVRNPTGVSHSPAEDVALEDAAIAAEVVRAALEEDAS